LKFEAIKNLASDDRTDGVNGIVSRQSLFRQTGECPDHGLVIQRQLVLDNRMNRGVQPPCAPG
jgi:hypothetical protein